MKIIIGADISQGVTGLNNFNKALIATGNASAKASGQIAKVSPGANQAGAALTNLGRVAQDLPFGFVGIQNNLNPLLESFQRLKAETGSGGAALKALAGSLIGAGGVGLALSVVSSAFVIFQNGIAGFNKKSKEAKEAADDLAKSIRSISSIQGEAIAGVQGQIAQVEALATVVSNANAPYRDRKRALDELKEINKSYFKDIQIEDAATGKLATTVRDYTDALINNAIQKQFVDEIATVAKAVVKQDEAIAKAQLKLAQAQQAVRDAENFRPTATRDIETARAKKRDEAIGKEIAAQKELRAENEKVTDLLTQEALLRDQLNKAVAEGLKYKDPDGKKGKDEVDLLKKRLEALEKIKDATKDATALVGLQESIFELQVKIAIRDQGKNQLTKHELDQQIAGFKAELQKAFEAQAIELESIPKIKFRSVSTIELPTDIESKVAKATGLDKRIPEITLHDVRVKLLGIELTNKTELQEKLLKQLNDSLNDIAKNVSVDAFAGIGEAIGEALGGGDIKNIFSSLFNIISSGLQQFGKALIAYGIAQKAFQIATKSLNPGVAIAAGVGLIAAGALLKKALPQFKEGGWATGPSSGYLAVLHGNELVIPENKIGRSNTAGIQGASFDQPIILLPSVVIQGQALRIMLDRVDRSNGRMF